MAELVLCSRPNTCSLLFSLIAQIHALLLGISVPCRKVHFQCSLFSPASIVLGLRPFISFILPLHFFLEEGLWEGTVVESEPATGPAGSGD